jgi:amidase
MNAKTLTSKQLVKAELYRIALTNADGPAIQAIRNVNPNAVEEADESDRLRFKKKKPPLGALAGIPVVVDDSINAFGLPTSGSSIALEDTMPSVDSTIVAKLKAAGAIVLGDANTTELGGAFEGPNMPQGYSSLGGQVLLASDTNKNVGGSSGGSADSVEIGYAPLAVGMETSTEAAQMIAPAGNAGVVGLKPTVGLISRTGILPVAKSQDSPGPIGQTVSDVATALGVLAGPDPGDPATLGHPAVPNYLTGLTPTALSGKKIAVVAAVTTVPYPEAVARLATLGATTNEVTPGAATTAPSIIPYEFHSNLNTFLSTPKAFTKHSKGARSLQEIIAYNAANPVEALKYGQAGLVAAEAVETSNPTTKASYEENLAKGKKEDQEVIDGILKTGGDSAIMVPSGSPLVGIADRAGYPVLTVPAGFGAENSSTGGDPIGVDFIGTAFSEAELLDDGYGFEQGTKARQTGPAYMVSKTFPNAGLSGAPSETNQSMFRCVLGSAFLKPYDCNPGELESPLPGAEFRPF